jgi:hypothetical protein
MTFERSSHWDMIVLRSSPNPCESIEWDLVKDSFPSELIPAVAKKSLETSIPTKRLYILAPPSEIKQDMPPNQTSTVTRVLFDPINLSGLREAGNTLKSGLLTQEGVRSPAFLISDSLISQLIVGGRNKRNFHLPIFQKEPMGRINEFTYEELNQSTVEKC